MIVLTSQFHKKKKKSRYFFISFSKNRYNLKVIVATSIWPMSRKLDTFLMNVENKRFRGIFSFGSSMKEMSTVCCSIWPTSEINLYNQIWVFWGVCNEIYKIAASIFYFNLHYLRFFFFFFNSIVIGIWTIKQISTCLFHTKHTCIAQIYFCICNI